MMRRKAVLRKRRRKLRSGRLRRRSLQDVQPIMTRRLRLASGSSRESAMKEVTTTVRGLYIVELLRIWKMEMEKSILQAVEDIPI